MSHSFEQDISPSPTDHPPCAPTSPQISSQHGYVPPSSTSLPPPLPTSVSVDCHPSHGDTSSEAVNLDKNTNIDENENEIISSSCTSNPLLCTICVDLASSAADVVTIPSCGHSFCLSCLASWFQIRHCCPNCKCTFSEVECSRAVENGDILSGPVTEDGRYPIRIISLSDMMVVPPQWLKTQLTTVHSAQHDIEHSFNILPTETQMSYQELMAMQQEFQNQSSVSAVPAPAYVCEEFEDELEDQFWQEEELVHQRYMRTARTISNRRYGNSGYLSAGRMHARPNSAASSSSTPGSSATHGKKKNKKHKNKGPIQDKRPASVAAASSSSRSQCISQAEPDQASTNCDDVVASSSSTQQKSGGRKKKMKKKSRAGIAAAKAAAEEAAVEKRASTSTSTPGSTSSSASQAASRAASSCSASAFNNNDERGEALRAQA